jgi:hypothetical protein
MYLVREIMHCKPGKVRPMVEKFLAMRKVGSDPAMSRMRVMTDVSAERYWTIVAEMEVEDLETFLAMDMSEDEAKQFEEIMKGYHDLVEDGRREIYRIEG